MTIGFKTHFPKRMGGGPTHFVEKIWEGIRDPAGNVDRYVDRYFKNDNSEILFYSDNGKRFDPYSSYAPKIHTIREDPHNRWRAGMKIHMAIGNQTPNRFQFAPTLVCTGVQKIEIKYVDMPMRSKYVICFEGKQAVINMHGRSLMEEEAQKLAINDGFESIEHFFQWFNEPFVGKLIHWTELKY